MKNFIRPFIYLVVLLLVGTSGYRIIEKWNTIDSLYMTVITITTVGFGEIHPMSNSGRLFTIGLLIGGVGFYGVVANSLIKNFIEIKFKDMVASLKMKAKVENMKDHYVICGGGRMAVAVGKELERSRKKFVFIENNPDAPVMEKEGDWPIIKKDALLDETLEEARIEYAVGLAAVLQSDSDNLYVVLSARRFNPNLYIVTRISFESTQSKMLQAGANKVVSPYVMGGRQIARSFISPEVSEFLEIFMDKASIDFEFKLHEITEGDPNLNRKIREANYRNEGFMVISIRTKEQNMIFAPDAEFVLAKGSEVLLLGRVSVEDSN
ncbi:MAG: NAD-binding protein [Leptospiraceae bacterium]|nr:NAD-binding protein [Leptospiraceae bacterium]